MRRQYALDQINDAAGCQRVGLYEDKPGGEDAYAPMYVAFRSCLNNKICWYWHRVVLCSGDVLSIGLGANRCQDRVVRA
jgi:hypothetical protein